MAKGFDPLLDSFAGRYVLPWSDRELGRKDSPLYLRPQLEEAHELFEKARIRWRDFDIEPDRRLDAAAVLLDYEQEGSNPRNVETARTVHRVLLTSSRYDIAKPDELYLGDLRMVAQVPKQIPGAALYASVAMCCAVVAADECYCLADLVETVASYRGKLNLADLHKVGPDLWINRMHEALRERAGDVVEAREYVALYLGAARTALALAKFVEADEQLKNAERLNADLQRECREQHVELNKEMRLRFQIDEQATASRERVRKQTAEANRMKSDAAEKRMRKAADLYKNEKTKHPSRGADEICRFVRADIKVTRRTLDKYLAEARRLKLLD